MTIGQIETTPLPGTEGTAPIAAPVIGTPDLPEPEPPVEGEPSDLTDGTDDTRTPYEKIMAQIESDSDAKDDHEFSLAQLKKAARGDAWKDIESRVASQQDDIRRVVQDAHAQITALTKQIDTDLDVSPEVAGQLAAAINGLKIPATWDQVGYPLMVVGTLLEDAPFHQEMLAGLQAVGNRKVSPEDWGKRYLTRVAENLPEDILREALKSSPALRKLRAEYRAEGRDGATKSREKAEDANGRVASRAEDGPDVPPRGSGSASRAITQESLAKMTPQQIAALPQDQVDAAMARGPRK